MSRPPSLAARLSLAIGGAVAVVISVAGVLVAIGVLGRFDAYLDAARRDRYEQVAGFAGDLVAARGGLDLKRQELRQLAVAAGGPIEIRDPAGVVVARLDSLPGIDTGPPGSRPVPGPAVAVPIMIDGREVGSLVVRPLAGVPESVAATPTGFRETATLILLGAGLAAILASIVVAFVVARRVTKPLRELAGASRRVGAGDLGTRVALPPDAEGRDLGIAFNAMAENLERSEQLRRRAANDLAHELATPVTVLAGRLQALSDGVITPDQAELAATRDAADEVRRLVADLQELAAAEGAALQRTVERVDLVELVRGTMAASRAHFSQAGVTLVGPPDRGGPVPVDVDRRQVERCLANLLTNAATYTPRGGRVEVDVSVAGEVARVRVRDTGPGIPAEHLAHVFERYYRADPSRYRAPGSPGGTGIGLTVARELALANGGRLSVEDTGPGGTAFLVELPVTR